MRHQNRFNAAWVAAWLFLPAPAAFANSLLAVDDIVVVEFNQLNDRTIIDFSYLLGNDFGATVDDVWIAAEPLHRDADSSGTVGTSYHFVPSETFWSLGSDQLTYELTAQGNKSTGTVFLLADLPTTSPMINEQFEPDVVPKYLLNNSGTNTVTVSTVDPIAGAGSLKVDIADAGAGDAYISLPYKRGDDDDEDELGGCYRAGGGRSPGQASAWIMVLQGPTLDPGQAPVRLLLQSDGALVAEVKGPTGFEASAPVYPINNVVHFKLLWSHRGGKLKALLRVDGLAVETPKVDSGPLEIDTAHIGGILAGDEGTFQVDLDLITGIVQSGLSIADRYFVEDFESGTLSGWDHVYGPGLEVGPGAAMSGISGLEASVLADSATFVSRALPVSTKGLTARFKVDARWLNLEAGRLISPVNLGSDNDLLFGTTDLALSLVGNSTSGVRATISTFYGENVRLGEWSPLSGEHIVEIQYRRSDTGADNGILRMWLDGEIATHQNNLPDTLSASERDPRGTQIMTWLHVGSKGFDPAFVNGTLAFDDVSVTRTE